MATATLSYNLKTLVGDNFDPRRTRVTVAMNVPLIVVDGTTIRPDDIPTQAPASDGTGSFTLVTTNSAVNPTSFAYTFHVDYVLKGNRQRRQWSSSEFTFTASANIAAIGEAFDGLAIAPTWQSDFRAEMEDIRDGALAINGPVDATVEALVNNTGGVGPLSSAAVTAKIAAHPEVTSSIKVREAPLSPYRYGLTDAMNDNSATATATTDALQATLNALPARNGAMLIPRGSWYCNGLVTSGRQFVIQGHGVHATSLKPTGSGNPMIHVSATTAPNYGSGVISNMTIGPTVATGTPGVGIKVEGAHAADVLIEDMWIGSMSTGIEFYLAPNCAVSRTVIEACQGAGIFASQTHLLTLTDLQTFQNNAHGIYLDACTSVLTVGGKMIENYNNGFFASGGGDISIVGTMFDNNSKDYSSGTPINRNLYDNIRFVTVNVGQITGTSHVNSLGFAFTRKGIDVDSSSYRVEVLGGVFNAGAFVTDVLNNASAEGQTITREKVNFRPKIKLGSIFLRDNAGVLEKSTDDTTWTPV